MIAEILAYLFVSLAAVPLVSILYHRFLDRRTANLYDCSFVAAVILLLWEGVRVVVAQGDLSLAILDRMFDPALVTLLLFFRLRPSGNLASGEKGRRLRLLGAILLANFALQILSLTEILPGIFLPLVGALVAVLATDRLLARWSEVMHYDSRILLWGWFVYALLVILIRDQELQIFRILYLAPLAWFFTRELRDVINGKNEALERLQVEKELVRELMAELTSSIRDVSDLKATLGYFLTTLIKAVRAKSGAIYLLNADDNYYRAVVVDGFFFPLEGMAESSFLRKKLLHDFVFSSTVTAEGEHPVWECGDRMQSIHIPFATRDSRVIVQGGNIQSVLLVPLVVNQQVQGVVVIQNKEYDRTLSLNDLSIVESFSHHGSLIINNARLYAEKSEKDRVSKELEIARKVQADLLPAKVPQYEGIKLSGVMIPAKEIGGDYFDFIEIDEDRLGFTVGDVSGKGIAAGMIMSIVHTLLRSLYRYFPDDTKALLVAVNTALSEKIKSTMFMTLVYYQYNAKTRKLVYTSCGHEHVLIWRAQGDVVECYKAGGLALGMTDDNMTFVEEKELPILPGDTLLMYTDGIAEARNPEKTMYGLDRLQNMLANHHNLEPEALRNTIVEDVRTFSAGAEQFDDITCLVVRF